MIHEDILKLLFPLKDVGGDFDADITIEGSYLDALKTSAEALLLELFPDTCTAATIADWERTYNIIAPDGASLAQRQLAIIQKKRLRRKLTKSYFETLAAAVGYTIMIEEIPPLSAEYGSTQSTIYIWRVHVLGGTKTIIDFTAGDSSAGDLLTDWVGEATLENIFERLKPAHTRVLFVYE